MNKPLHSFYKLLFFAGIIVSSFQSIAQVTAGDSIALVGLYTSTGGASWTNHTNWATSSRVSTWYGVTTRNSRVIRVSLPSNNLTGAVTDSLVRLDSIKNLNLAGNRLTYFPALTSSHLDTLSLQNNKLTFRDLLPNKSHVDSFYYAPQDSVEIAVDTTVTEQSSVSLRTAVDNTPQIGDNYEWFKNTTSIVSGPSNVYSILCMDSASAGTYYTKITNLALPKLTLYRRAITLHVNRLADPGAPFAVCATASTLQGVLPAGGSVVWSVLSGGASIARDSSATTAISNLTVGANVFKYSVSAGNVSCAAGTYSTALITVTRDTTASPASAGPDQSTCSTQAILQGATPAIGTGTWTVTKGTAVVTSPNNPNSAVTGLTSAENIFRWQITNGACVSTFFDEVKIYKDDTLTTVSAGTDASICPTAYNLNTTLPDNTNGTWSVVSGSATFSDIHSTNPSVSGLSELDNVLRWTVSNTCNTVSADIHVNVFKFLTANAGPDKEVYYSPINTYTLADTITVATGGDGHYSYSWSPATNIDDTSAQHPKFLTPDSGSYIYTVTVTDGHGCTASDDVNYHILRIRFLAVPTLFTPNDDNLNDELFIPGVESYPNNELTVVDRNNQIVYKHKGYKNDWKGINEEGFSKLGEKLPVDTYYYTLKLEDGIDLQKGFFLIKY